MLIVIHAYFTTWQKIILHQMPATTLRTRSGYRSLLGFTPHFGGLFMLLKVQSQKVNFPFLKWGQNYVYCGNFPFDFHGYSIKLRRDRDHRCLLWHFLLTSTLVLSHYFHLLRLVSLCINPNSIKAHVPVSW